MPNIGDNSALNATAQQKLRSYVDRAKSLEDEKAALSADLSEVYKEAKGDGFDTKIVRKAVKHLRDLEKHGAAKLAEEAALFDMYLHAVQPDLFP